jgi:EAL domain-containing protein (putative c-di-GMP-specific phosphodiesterase class I)
VENLSCESPEGSLAASIIRIGEGLRLTTVAEGIEDSAQHEALGRLRCDLGQGYRFSPPLDASAFEDYLATGSGGKPAAVTIDAW